MQFLIGFLIFIGFLFVMMVGSAMLRLRKIRWTNRTYYHPQDESSIDPMIQAIFQGTVDKLSAFGFEPAFWISIHEPYFVDERVSSSRVLFHPDTRTYAQIGLHPLPEVGESVAIDFYNFYRDQTICFTTNCTRHFVGGDIDGYDWEDPYAATLDEHWSYHQQRLSRDTRPALMLSVEEFCDWGNRFMRLYQTELVDRGDMRPVGAQSYQLSFGGAWRVIKRTQAGQKKLKPILLERSRTAAEAMTSEVEVLAHQRHDSMMGNTPAGVKGKLILLIVSAGLFMASFGYRLNLEALLILFGVLFFHELGHVAAMRVFAYKDLKILFIPFLGAVATGRKTSCPAWQSAIIYLAGPVPGILLAMALWYAGGVFPGLWEDIAWMPVLIAMLFFINFFNLLPIQPLDGGQLANVLIFQRWPKLQVIFFGVSVAAFMTLAWGLEEPLLAGVGFLIGFSALYQYREAKVLNHLRRMYPGLGQASKQEKLLAIYRSIKEQGIQWAYATRHQAAKNLLERLGSPLPGLKETMAGLSLYLIFLLGVPLAFVEMGYYPAAAWFQQDKIEAPDWQALLENAADDTARLSVLMDALEYHRYSESTEVVLAYGRQAREILVRTNQTDSSAMADVLLQMAESRLDYEEDLSPSALRTLVSQDIAKVIAIYERLDESQFAEGSQESNDPQVQEPDYLQEDEWSAAEFRSLQLATAYELKSRIEEELGDYREALNSLETANEYWLKFPEADQWQVHTNLESEARLYVALGEYEAAEAQYLDTIQWVNGNFTEDQGYYINGTLQLLTAFYLDQQQYQQALDAVNQYRVLQPDQDYYATGFAEMQGWAHFKLAQYEESVAKFEQAILEIERRQQKYPRYKRGYQKADNISRLLLVHHSQARNLEVNPNQPDTNAADSNDAVSVDIVRLLTELEATKHSVEDYIQHLECECNRHAGGYRLDQSESMRDVVMRYLNTAGNSL